MPERLKLFEQICVAIQHAHHKGIIHRDLKPTNIIVGLDGDKPVAKVIDFGIAKAMQRQLTDKTLFTATMSFELPWGPLGSFLEKRLAGVVKKTVADVACFPYVALSGDGGISLDDYNAIRRWISRIKKFIFIHF